MSTFLGFAYFNNYLQANEIAWKRGQEIFSEPDMPWNLSGEFWKVFKGCVATFLLVCFLSLKDGTCETRKSVLYFTSKALLVLKKIKV